MSGKPLEFHPEAVVEAEAAVVWYRERSLRAAGAFLAKLEDAIRIIRDAPERWPAFHAGTRRLPLRQFLYFVVYRDGVHSSEVLAVAHGRRRPGYWRSRRE